MFCCLTSHITFTWYDHQTPVTAGGRGDAADISIRFCGNKTSYFSLKLAILNQTMMFSDPNKVVIVLKPNQGRSSALWQGEEKKSKAATWRNVLANSYSGDCVGSLWICVVSWSNIWVIHACSCEKRRREEEQRTCWKETHNDPVTLSPTRSLTADRNLPLWFTESPTTFIAGVQEDAGF